MLPLSPTSLCPRTPERLSTVLSFTNGALVYWLGFLPFKEGNGDRNSGALPYTKGGITHAMALHSEPEPTTQTCDHPRCRARDQVLDEFLNSSFLTDRLYRLVQHAMSQCIAAHGPITRDFLPSATKRCAQSIRNSLRELVKLADDHC